MNKEFIVKTNFLLKERNFLTGVSSIFAIFGQPIDSMFNTSKSPEEADKNAIFSDWAMVGKDFKTELNNEFSK